jgi:hypothetical protein
MYAGNKVFEMLFKGSEYGNSGFEYEGISNKNFLFWITTFENVVADITDEYNPEIFSSLEKWYKCIRIMINMYKLNNKQTAEMNFSNHVDAVGARDIDHYYLSITQDKLPFKETQNLNHNELTNKTTDTRKMCLW